MTRDFTQGGKLLAWVAKAIDSAYSVLAVNI